MDNDGSNTDNVDDNDNNNSDFNNNKLIILQKACFLGRISSMTYIHLEHPVLKIAVGHHTFSNQILKMSGQFHIIMGHND